MVCLCVCNGWMCEVMMWNVDVGKLLGCFEVFVCMGVFGLYCVLMFWVV